MSTLDSTSTLAEVQAAYDDNASYEEEGSLAKAAAFVTACRILRRRILRVSQQGSTRAEIDPATLQVELQAAQRWIAANSANAAAGGGTRFSSFEEFR